MLSLAPRRDPQNVSEGELKLGLLLDLGAMIAQAVELDELLTQFGERVAQAMCADRATLWLIDAATGELITRVANLPELEQLRLPIGRGVAGYVARVGELVNIRDAASDERWAPEIDQQTGYRTESMLCAPIVDRDGPLRGVVQVLNKRDGCFTEHDEAYLRAIAEQIARALEYTSLRGAGTPRGVPVRGRFNHIVGWSDNMRDVYDLVLRAAKTDATVLLHGETGTGKGLFARAIHVNSNRQSGPFVHVDCTNLPATLVESELFGHERGAYTGADALVKGKVELASGGTLFLDELGEVPLALQGKLLRFIQDRQYERVGGRETFTADVRIVAATNRDLLDMVGAGTFRSDLYYRIRVLDIELPPLRVRGTEQILLLADHFTTVYGGRYHKGALRISAAARDALAAHEWPGNVRELEHAIERGVVLCRGDVIEADDLGLLAPRPAGAPREEGSRFGIDEDMSLAEVEQAYARAALKRCGGNQSAAARSLGIGRNKLARLLKDE